MKKITRLSELLDILNGSDVNSFVYVQQTKAGAILTIEEPIRPGQDEYTTTSIYMTPAPSSDRPAQEFLKDIEHVNDKLTKTTE